MITVSGVDELASLARGLRTRFPKETRRAVQTAVSDAVRRTSKKGVAIAASEYLLSKNAKKKISAGVRIKWPSKDLLEGEVTFRGKPGMPLRNFRTSPARGFQNFRGVVPQKRRPKQGVSVRVRRAGKMRPALGPHGEKSFWFQTGHGFMLGYRNRLTNKLTAEDLMGASPIQALQKEKNVRKLSEYAQNVMRERVNHQLSRLMKRKGL